MIRFRSIQTKIALLAGGSLVLTAGIIGTSSFFMLKNSASEAAWAAVRGEAAEQAGEIGSTLGRSLSTAESLANTLAGVKDPEIELAMSRESALAVLRSVLAKDPALQGVYTAWEPNAFDDLDLAYEGVDGHDATGRFIPYAFRDDSGGTGLRPIESVDGTALMPSGFRAGEAYLAAREAMAPVVLPPMIPPGSDKPVVSIAAPIAVGDTFYGIVGIDLPLAFIDRTVAAAPDRNPGAEAIVIAPGGRIAGWTDHPSTFGKMVDASDEKLGTLYADAVDQKQASAAGNGYMSSLQAVSLPGVAEPWVVGTRIPEAAALASVTKALRTQFFMSAGLVAFGLVAVFLAARSVARPIGSAAITPSATSPRVMGI